MLSDEQQLWIQGPSVLCHGLRIGFRATQPELLTGVQSVFSPGWRSSPDITCDDVLYSLNVDNRRREYTARVGTQLITAPTAEQLFEALRVHLHQTIAEHATEHVFVHAGAVASGQSVILIPGRSHSGKSTLVRELVRAGAVYFSDEYAALDERGMVHPFARPLSLRSRNRRVLYDPREHGEQIGSEALPVGLVVLTTYVPTAKWKPVRVTPGQALLEIAENTVSIRANPERVLRILSRVVAKAPALRSPRADAAETAPAVLSFTNTSHRRDGQ